MATLLSGGHRRPQLQKKKDALVDRISRMPEQMNVVVVPPDVNASIRRFHGATGPNCIWRLSAIKGCGVAAADAIAKARAEASTRDILIFVRPPGSPVWS